MKKEEKNIMCNLWISYSVQVVWGLVKDPLVHEKVVAGVVGHHKVMARECGLNEKVFVCCNL